MTWGERSTGEMYDVLLGPHFHYRSFDLNLKKRKRENTMTKERCCDNAKERSFEAEEAYVVTRAKKQYLVQIVIATFECFAS